MNKDELIYQAFLNNPLQGEGLYVVEGNPAKNELRIVAGDQCFKDNLNCFAWNLNTGLNLWAYLPKSGVL